MSDTPKSDLTDTTSGSGPQEQGESIMANASSIPPTPNVTSVASVPSIDEVDALSSVTLPQAAAQAVEKADVQPDVQAPVQSVLQPAPQPVMPPVLQPEETIAPKGAEQATTATAAPAAAAAVAATPATAAAAAAMATGPSTVAFEAQPGSLAAQGFGMPLAKHTPWKAYFSKGWLLAERIDAALNLYRFRMLLPKGMRQKPQWVINTAHFAVKYMLFIAAFLVVTLILMFTALNKPTGEGAGEGGPGGVDAQAIADPIKQIPYSVYYTSSSSGDGFGAGNGTGELMYREMVVFAPVISASSTDPNFIAGLATAKQAQDFMRGEFLTKLNAAAPLDSIGCNPWMMGHSQKLIEPWHTNNPNAIGCRMSVDGKRLWVWGVIKSDDSSSITGAVFLLHRKASAGPESQFGISYIKGQGLAQFDGIEPVRAEFNKFMKYVNMDFTEWLTAPQ